jgi:uncharacterized protein YegL
MADLEIFMIIDGSGSMGGVKGDVVDGVNKFIDDQKDDAVATGDQIMFSLVVFDDQVSEVYDTEDVSLVNSVTVKETFRGGSTALYDAIGRTISKAEDNNTPKLVVVYTDGQENASREYTADQVKKMIEDFQATGIWTFVYMSAELADFSQPSNLGFAAGNILTGTTRGTTHAHFANISASSTAHRHAGGGTNTAYYATTMDSATLDAMGGKLATDVAIDPTLLTSDPGDETDKKDDDNAS